MFVKIKDFLNVDWVKQNRDRVWSEAVHLYKENYQWWLTQEEELLSEEHNNKFKEKSSFESTFVQHVEDNYLTENKPFVLMEVLNELNLQPARYVEAASKILEREFKLKKPTQATRLSGVRRRWWNLQK